MNRLEKCQYFESKGYTYDKNTGKIFGMYGKEISGKDKDGYIILQTGLKAHHYAYYSIYGNVDFIMLDHINRIVDDNRIENLRIVTHQENQWNNGGKGCYLKNNKWMSQIQLNNKKIHLGYFNTEEEARQAYLEAKKKYHKIQ